VLEAEDIKELEEIDYGSLMVVLYWKFMRLFQLRKSKKIWKI
jgi:hypothetical protein